MIVREIENFDQQLHFKDPFYSSVFESDKIQKLAEHKRQELAASLAVERATSEAVALSRTASLDEAKLNYRRQQYEHSLKVSDYQVSLQKQQEQINSLQTQSLCSSNPDSQKVPNKTRSVKEHTSTKTTAKMANHGSRLVRSRY